MSLYNYQVQIIHGGRLYIIGKGVREQMVCVCVCVCG
jgi:hypothetical protein